MKPKAIQRFSPVQTIWQIEVRQLEPGDVVLPSAGLILRTSKRGEHVDVTADYPKAGISTRTWHGRTRIHVINPYREEELSKA